MCLVYVYECVYTHCVKWGGGGGEGERVSECMCVHVVHYSIYTCSISNFQIHHEAKVEEEKEKQFVAQAFAAGSMKHGGGSRRGSTKPDDWAGGGKGDRDRDRRDKDRDRGDRDRDRDRDKPKEKLDARKLQFTLLKQREKSKDPGVNTCTYHPLALKARHLSGSAFCWD